MEWILAALLGGALAFNQIVTPDAAAKRAEKALQKTYPGAKVNVDIEGKRGKAVLNGKFDKIRLDINGATFDSIPFSSEPPGETLGETKKLEVRIQNANWEGFPVESIAMDFENLRYDWKALKDKSQFRIASVGPATLRVRLGAQSLLPKVGERVKGAKDVALRLQEGQFILNGAREVFELSAPFELRAQPSWSGNRVGLANPSLKISNLPVPSAVAKPILGDLSDFYTFDRKGTWPLKIEITSVRAEGDAMEIDANLMLKTAR